MVPHLITIPSTDRQFRLFVERALAADGAEAPGAFEARLRRTYPRAVVRERGLAGESASWYVYRDGTWSAPDADSWWNDPRTPRVDVSPDGWMVDLNPPARALLGVDANDIEPRHFTDFVVPGGADGAAALFDIVRETGALDATVLLQPAGGDAMAVEVHAAAGGEGIVGSFRLAANVDIAVADTAAVAAPRLDYQPPTDVAFRAYAARSLARMPEPTPDGLALRLRRLYPHAHVEVADDGWLARRDASGGADATEQWWLTDGLPCVRYDSEALIVDANDQASEMFGRTLVGHHWQEFVTAGSTDEVAIMLDILAEAGAAESRFRMPRPDGAFLEFDSYTVAEGGEFTTVFRPVAG